MSTSSPDDAENGGAIHITGSVTGNVQSGSHATASYVQSGPVHHMPVMLSPQAQALVEAVQRVRDELDSQAEQVPESAARAAQAALNDAEDAVGEPGEPDPGRIRQAVYTATGALATVAGLATALQALREAAAPWL